MKRQYYKVAGHCFAVEAEESLLAKMKDYEPFKVDESDGCLFVTEVRIAPHLDIEFTEELTRTRERMTVTNGHTADGCSVYVYSHQEGPLFWLVCEEGHRSGILTMTGEYPRMCLDMGITIMYRYTTIGLMTTEIHASTVSYKGRAYLFLGISGTGKSTHSQLWLKYFEGAELVNDDKPVVRIMDDGQVRVYGSPWSGKTPCYRNVEYPVGAMVKLNQAPHNRIRRLNPVEAYYVMLHSVFGKRWDKSVSNLLHQFEERLIASVPIWHLECRPDEEAARLCRDMIVTEENNK